MTRHATSWAVAGALLLLAIGYVGSKAVPRSIDSPYDLTGFTKLPVVHGGRVKPIDSMARQALLMISDRRTYEDPNGGSRPAVKWLLEVMTATIGESDTARHMRVFRIDNKQLVASLGLPERDGWRYALSEFQPKLDELMRQAQAAAQIDERERSLFQNRALELASQLDVVSALASWRMPHVIPPTSEDDEWATLFDSAHAAQARGEKDPGAEGFGRLLANYAAGDEAGFNRSLAAYRADLKRWAPDAVGSAATEYHFNQFAPLYQSAALYVGAFILVSLAWLTGWPLLRGASALVLLSFALHTGALIVRMILQDRPPVTNLYSSAVFVGWAAVALAMILELINRRGIGAAMAAIAGFATLIIAINLELAADGETLEMMQAVLDTNFWLATHVVTVTIGYAATFMAGLLGIGLVIWRLISGVCNDANAKALARMIYGTVCFALLFSFVGTVLGGIWADQSWGRFWGWDPKENGALIIVVWNALILHARWGGLVRERGIAVLAVFGNIVTSWSWFGVNMLGVGLHSYGFMDHAAFWLSLFILSQLLIIALGLMPARPFAAGGAR